MPEAVKKPSHVKKHVLTREQALSLVARRRELGIRGGRPKGVLGAKKRAAIKSAEAFVAATTEKLGDVADDLLINSRLGDTAASKVILDRTMGAVRQDMHLTGEFALKALHVVALPVKEHEPEQSPIVGAPAVVPLVAE